MISSSSQTASGGEPYVSSTSEINSSIIVNPSLTATYTVTVTSPKNIKNKTILYTIYSAGIRLGELIRLTNKDIRSEDGYIFIKDSKDKKGPSYCIKS